jgi:hypothetical protein
MGGRTVLSTYHYYFSLNYPWPLHAAELHRELRCVPRAPGFTPASAPRRGGHVADPVVGRQAGGAELRHRARSLALSLAQLALRVPATGVTGRPLPLSVQSSGPLSLWAPDAAGVPYYLATPAHLPSYRTLPLNVLG